MPKEMNYRPLVHFAPLKGWINDPNGMVYIDGEYHLFFQHYPDAPTWGPMHWGHAVSRDLLHWEQLPVAIYPDELGMVFSGSCVYDKDNVSGLGSKDFPFVGIHGKPPLIAIYTSHGMKVEEGKFQSREQQSVAYSTDLVHFEKYYGNPVIPNSEKNDFRDPKAFWNPVRNCYSLVLAAGPNVEFYASKNLLDWEYTGSFHAGDHGIGGICECPDCFPIRTEDGQEKWVLFISMILPEEKFEKNLDAYDRISHITQYYVGEFDGDTFHDTEEAPTPLLVDWGTDNYAPVTFQNLEEKVLMGWGDNWDYARESPTGDIRGKMTLARRMRLVKTEEGYRLACSIEGLEELKAGSRKLEKGRNRLRTDAFGLKVKVGGCGQIVISNGHQEKIVISLTEEEIIVDRRLAGQKDFDAGYAKDSYGLNRAPRHEKTDPCMDILFDRSILEVLADQGKAAFSVNVYPEHLYDEICVEGDLEAEIYLLK